MTNKALTLLATLTWTLPQGVFDFVKVYKSPGMTQPFTLIGTAPGTATSFVDSAGAPGDCYRVTVTRGSDESQASNNACLFVILPVPTSLGLKP